MRRIHRPRPPKTPLYTDERTPEGLSNEEKETILACVKAAKESPYEITKP